MASIQAAFMEFHQRNPHVYALFLRFAFELKAAGKRGSAKLIFERMRWELALNTETNDEFKLNNNYSSRYARAAIEEYPELKDFFRFRELKNTAEEDDPYVDPYEVVTRVPE